MTQMMVNSTHQTLDSRVKTLELTCDGVRMLDQTRLPSVLDYVMIQTPQAMAEAIQTMIVRGAPAIGIAGAYGVVLSARQHRHTHSTLTEWRQAVCEDATMLRASRPTAVNLAWALDQMLVVLEETVAQGADVEKSLSALTEKADTLLKEDIAANQAMGALGASLVPKGARILTHCNAGALATGGYGTALGVVRSAFAQDPTVTVYADETRPRLQGARLTTWELIEDGIPVTLITDGMSGSLMQAGKVDLVIVGADRIAANGDTANKIGTYNLALVAHAHQVPFYVAAPTSTLDLSLASGQDIPIEMRDPAEIYEVNGETLCANGTQFYNPAFDVTPARYVTAIITERGIARPDFETSLHALFSA